MHTVGVILAGGASSRMGTDKSMLRLGDRRSVEVIFERLDKVVDETILVTNKPEIYEFLDVDTVPDIFIGKGPLAGLHAAMHHKKADAYILSACDMPLIQPEVCSYLIEKLGDHDAVLPIHDARRQPLAAVYRHKALETATELLEKNELKIGLLFQHLDTLELSEFPFDNSVLEKHFFNMNHPHEYEMAKSYFKN